MIDAMQLTWPSVRPSTQEHTMSLPIAPHVTLTHAPPAGHAAFGLAPHSPWRAILAQAQPRPRPMRPLRPVVGYPPAVPATA